MPSYYQPTTLEEALRVLEREGAEATLVAGGTDLMPRFWTRDLKTPPVLVNLKRVAELRFIRREKGELVLGPATTINDILFSAELAEHVPMLPEVANRMAGPQIRNMATIGGNVCNASPAADMVNPLIVLGARLELSRCDGATRRTRRVAVERFFKGPGETVLRPGELLTAIHVPLPTADFRYGFEKFGRRPAMNCSVVTVGVGARVDGEGKLHDVRIALGSVAPVPLRARQTEAALESWMPDEAVITTARAVVEEEIDPISDLRGGGAFRRELVGVLLGRAVETLSRADLPRPAFVWPGDDPATSACGHAAHTAEPDAADAVHADWPMVSFTLNGDPVTALVDPLVPLITVLRHQFGLHGTKLACGEGECGACTVLVDGDSVNACLYRAMECDGREVLTIEGLARDGTLSRLQQAFVDHGAVQCGFCTPGMIMQAYWLLCRGGPLDEDVIKRSIEGNLCRCTGYVQIVEAIQSLADEQWALAVEKGV